MKVIACRRTFFRILESPGKKEYLQTCYFTYYGTLQ